MSNRRQCNTAPLLTATSTALPHRRYHSHTSYHTRTTCHRHYHHGNRHTHNTSHHTTTTCHRHYHYNNIHTRNTSQTTGHRCHHGNRHTHNISHHTRTAWSHRHYHHDNKHTRNTVTQDQLCRLHRTAITVTVVVQRRLYSPNQPHPISPSPLSPRGEAARECTQRPTLCVRCAGESCRRDRRCSVT